ncbi:MAG TPA: hypothetical protein VF665_04505 [Longimicrobium sp.]|jgi:hypothetical protein|uniref:hypothetical protein n=1 Tax=Longimicrobium sp. TaxID=2029185 RepID=UPI002EDAB34F
MTDFTPASRSQDAGEEPLLDSFLREAIPEIKLALGDLIDRDNARAIPDRYVKMLPLTTLVVTLRPDAAQAVAEMAADLEADLTDSVMRHGSLYDRDYRVRLKEAGSRGAPLFRVGVQPAGQADPDPIVPAPPPPPPPAPAPSASTEFAGGGATEFAPRPAAPPMPAWAPSGPPPVADPDATRVEGLAPPPAPSPSPAPAAGWDAERFTLVVEEEDGTERERHPIPGPTATVGRQTDNPALRSDIQMGNSPNVSRRQLALVWAQRDGRAGFDVFNLGLNDIHAGEREVPGANAGKGDLNLESLRANSLWVPPGEAIRIGGHGPVVRIVERETPAPAEINVVPGDLDDPDRTQFG